MASPGEGQHHSWCSVCSIKPCGGVISCTLAHPEIMADPELQTFTSVMDALVRISVSTRYALLLFACYWCGCTHLSVTSSSLLTLTPTEDSTWPPGRCRFQSLRWFHLIHSYFYQEHSPEEGARLAEVLLILTVKTLTVIFGELKPHWDTLWMATTRHTPVVDILDWVRKQ